MNAPCDRVAAVAAIAARHADSVDREARFPREAVAALKDARLLSMMIPQECHGGGASLADVAEVCTTLGEACASTALIFAMHQISVASLVTHAGESDWRAAFLRRICEAQLLLGSATTEGGVGGAIRASVCAFEVTGDRFRVEKKGALISYGAQADAILLTARRAPDAPASDQLMAAVCKDQYTLERTAGWDTLGMRGTCSEGFTLRAEAPAAQILGRDFAEIAAQSMLATAHLLWSAVWYGVAFDALARARNFLRNEARRNPGVAPPGARRLAEASTTALAMRATIVEGLDRFARAAHEPEALNSIGFAIAMNNLKTGASQMAVEIVNQALLVTGLAGYRNDTPYSLGRHMRDALSAPIMISNDRIYGNVAQLLVAQRLDRGLAV